MKTRKHTLKRTTLFILLLVGWIGAYAQSQSWNPNDPTHTHGTFTLDNDVTVNHEITLTGNLTINVGSSGHTIHKGDFRGKMFTVPENYTLKIFGREGDTIFIDGGITYNTPNDARSGINNSVPNYGQGCGIRAVGNLQMRYVVMQNFWNATKDETLQTYGRGAAIISDDDVTDSPKEIILNHVLFRGCAAMCGSVIYSGGTDYHDCTFTDVTIKHCYTYGQWLMVDGENSYFGDGMIRTTGGSRLSLVLDACDIYENLAQGTERGLGAGITWLSGGRTDGDATLTITNHTRVHNNVAQTSGGGIFLNGNMNLISVEIYENHANRGGGICMSSYTGSVASFNGKGAFLSIGEDVSIHHNVATDRGGGIELRIIPSDDVGFTADDTPISPEFKLIINGANIYENQSNKGAGIAILDEALLKHYNPDINKWSKEYRRNVYITDGSVHDNIGIGSIPKGAGIYISKQEYENYGGLGYTYADAGGAGTLTFTASGGDICLNQANNGGGGGVYIEDRFGNVAPYYSVCNVDVTGSNVYNNSAKDGAGFYIKNGTVTIERGRIGLMADGTVAPNTATGNGGGFFISNTNTGTTTIKKNAKVKHNVAVNGGGFFVNNGSVTICSDGNARPEISYNEVTNNGGGIYVKEGEVTYSGGNLTNNTAMNNGGGIYVGGGDVNYSNGYVTNNVATTGNGGGIYMGNGTLDYSGGSVTDNTAFEHGGGIYIYNGSVEISNSNGDGLIARNEATTGNGGGIYKGGNGTLTYSGSSVTDNTALVHGGGIYLADGNVTYSNGSVTNNEATTGNGGGIYMGNGTLNYSGGSVTDNTALVHGGGIYLADGDVTYSNGSVTNNEATTGNGGGIYMGNGDLTYSNGSISTNLATNGNGGGIYVNNGDVTMPTGTIGGNTDALGNTATNGGGIFVTGNGNVTITGTVSHNEATSDGGGIYFGSGNGSIDIRGHIEDNWAGHNGGGAYFVERNNILVPAGSYYIHNIAENNGGGIYSEGGSLTFSNGDVTRNEALNGGGFYMNNGGNSSNNGTFTFEDGTLCGNKAVGSGATGGFGGGIFNNGGATYINSGTIGGIGTPNTAVDGGGIYIANGGTLNTGICNVIGNMATNQGGGIYVKNGTAEASGSTVSSNIATYGGGGIYVDGGSLNYSGGKVSDNKAFFTTATQLNPEPNLFEDFETSSVSIEWQSGSYSPWSIVSGGPDGSMLCARSGSIGDNNNGGDTGHSDLYFTMNIPEPGCEISFWKKVSTEYFDNSGLTFYIDDTQKGSWMEGVYGWSKVHFLVEPGTHTFTWKYEKHDDIVSDEDCAWIDNVRLSPIPPIAYNYSVSEGSGGGIYVNNGTTNITDGTIITKNEATIHGGGIYAYGGEVSATNNTVSSNVAFNGGGIYVDNDGTLNYTDGVVTNNRATGNACVNQEPEVNRFEGFESGGLYTFEWQTYGTGVSGYDSYLWSVVTENPHTGNYCVKSGNIPLENRHTDLFVTVDIPAPCEISFYVKVSTEHLFRFYINDSEKGRWSGEFDWIQVFYYLDEAGTYTFKWVFETNVHSFHDDIYQQCAWIDDIQFGPNIPATYNYIENPGGDGGGIYVNNGTTNIDNSTLNSNKATVNGGGIYTNGGKATLKGVTVGDNSMAVDNNTAANGAGIYIANNGELDITNCAVSNNTASSQGGGIYVDDGITVAKSSIVTGNIGVEGGGGFYLNSGNLTGNNVEVTNNATQVVTVVEHPEINLFEGFETGDFSAYHWTFEGSPWTIESSEPHSGDYCAKTSVSDYRRTRITTTVEIPNNCEITFWRKVQTEEYGGSLGFSIDEETQGTWQSSYDWGQESYPVTAGLHTFSWYTFNTLSGTMSAWIDDIQFGPMVPAYNSYIVTSSEGDGGGFYIVDGTIDCTDCEVESNTATKDGGGFYATGSTMTVEATVNNNTALDGNGGGFYLLNNSSVSIDGSASHNTAAYDGGGIYASGEADLTVTADVEHNAANKGDGGGLYLADITKGTVSGSTDQNTAALNGGGLYVTGESSSVTYTGGEVVSNTAIHGGGAYVENGTVTVKNGANIKFNEATSGNGGGINLAGGHLKANNVHIDNNTALGATTPEMFSFSEDFETGTLNSNDNDWEWQTSENAWTVVTTESITRTLPWENGTTWCAKANTSGPSELSVELEVPTAGNITFSYCSSINNTTCFYVDGVERASWGNTYDGSGSGYYKWLDKTIPISAGTHILKWAFPGGGSGDYGSHIDKIQFASTTAPVNLATDGLGKGGGLYLSGGTFECSGSTVSSNAATYDGGGIYADIDITAFSDNTVSGNTSQIGDGGGIYIAEDRQASITGGSVENNKALNGRRASRAGDDEGFFEGFENCDGSFDNLGNASYGTWETVGYYWDDVDDNYKWTIVSDEYHTNSFSAKSGALTHGHQHSDLTLTVDLPTYGDFSFYMKATKPNYPCSQFTFCIDGEPVGYWNPSFGWSRIHYPVSAGTHTFMWSLGFSCAEGYLSDGDHCDAWVDDIQFTPFDFPETPDTKGNGGGIFANAGSTLGYTDGTVSGNEAVNGGGIYANLNEATITGADTEIKDNRAVTHGGGIYVRQGNLTYTGGAVSGNTATEGNGGGLYIREAEDVTLAGGTIGGDTDAKGNTAVNGGGIYMNGGTLHNVENTSGTISHNTATAGDGGGMYVAAGQGILSGFTFSDNKALGSAGSGNAGDSFLEDFESGNFTAFNNWQFSGSTYWTVTTDQHHSGSYSAKSGANSVSEIILTMDVLADGEISFYFKKVNEAPTLYFYIDNEEKGSWSDDYESGWNQVSYPVTSGVRTFVWRATSSDRWVWIDDIQFTPNDNVTGSGGGLFVDGSDFVYKNCAFNNNSALYGGGIYINEGTTLNLQGVTTVSNNHVPETGQGGGIYQNGKLYVGDEPGDALGTHSLLCDDNYAGDTYQFDLEHGLNNRNNVYLPTHEKFLTLLSDISGRSNGTDIDSHIGFSVKPDDFNIPVVNVEDPQYEPWLNALTNEQESGHGAVFDDAQKYIVVHTRRNMGPFDMQFIYFTGCWTTVVDHDPNNDLSTYPLPEGVESHWSMEDGIYHIHTSEGLAWLSSLVNGLNGQTANRSMKAVLDADVDMIKYLWTPIGSVSGYNSDDSSFDEDQNLYFTGEFDGRGHVINGILNGILTGISRYGLFGGVGGGAKVKNTFLDNYANFAIHSSDYTMGGVAGVAAGLANIYNCEARGGMDLIDAGSGSIAGGIVGLMENTTMSLHSCMALPRLYGTSATMGGLVGSLPSGAKVMNSFVHGEFNRIDEDPSCHIGGLVGDNQGAVENCYVLASDNWTAPSGFGWFAGTGTGSFSYCYAPEGETNYGPGSISGHGNFGPTHLVDTKYGFAHQDQQVTKAAGQTNNYVVNGPIGNTGELTGLLATLNKWVKDPDKGWDEGQNLNDNGYSLWTRTMASPMNGDYPVLEFNDFVCAASEDGDFMSYGYDLNDKINEYGSGDGLITWTNDEDYPWTLSETNPHSGSYCMASSNVDVWGTTSTITAVVNLETDMTLSFWSRISVDDVGYFKIDDNQVLTEDDYNWTQRTFQLSAGTHTLAWEHTKINYESDYEDQYYVDDITLTAITETEVGSSIGFESGIPDGWSNDATHPWQVWSTNPHGGSTCIASNNVGESNTTSTISATFTFDTPLSVNFYSRISSEEGWDYGFFYIDDTEQFYESGNSNVWARHSIEVSEGTHTLSWKYTKDRSSDVGEDRYFIDDLSFTVITGMDVAANIDFDESRPDVLEDVVNGDMNILLLYKTNPTVLSSSTQGSIVYIKPDISVLQEQGSRIIARVGVALDNSSVGFMSSDWHMFSSALKAAPMGLKYTRIGIGDSDYVTSDPDYPGDYWVANHYCDSYDSYPSGGYYDYGVPHDVYIDNIKMNAPKTHWKTSIGQMGYFPTDTPYGPWRGQTPQQAYYNGEESHIGYFDFYTWDEPSYHWINFKREGFYYGYDGSGGGGHKSKNRDVSGPYSDHWHQDATVDGQHLRIDYTNETEMVPGRGYLLSISNPSMLMTDGVLNNGEISIDLTAVAQKPIVGGGGEDCMGESKSILTTTVTFEETGSVGFWCRVSTYDTYNPWYNYGDLLMEDADGHAFSVTDDNMHAYNESEGGFVYYDNPSEWRYHQIDDIPAGTYTLEWTYQRGDESGGEDRYYIDDITFTGVSGGPVTVDFENGIPSGWLTGVDIINLEYVQEYGYESVEAYLLDWWGVSSLEELQETFGYWYSFVPWDRNVHGGSYCLASTNSYHECSGGGSGGSSSGDWLVMSEEDIEAYRGTNLIGNPYQSYLDFDAFAEENYINSYYIFDADKRGYIAYVKDGSSPDLITEDIVDYSAPQYLHPHQGFFVRIEDEFYNVRFTNAMRSMEGASTFRNDNHYPMINLICSDTEGRNEFATVEVGRPDKEGGRKIKGLHMGDASLWVRFDDKDWHVAFTPLGTKSVPVRFKAYTDGVFTMKWQAANTNFSYLHLIDNLTGMDIDCLAEKEYIFEGKTKDYKSRFKLVFDYEGNEAPEVPEEPEEPEVPEPAEELTIFAFQMGDQLIVNGEGTLQMFDIQGRCLLEKGMVGAQSAVSLPKVASGVYVLRLIGTNKVKTQKIVINKYM